MNSKFIKASLLFISASVLFIAGCGPQDMNDAGYVAQTENSGLTQDVLNKDDQGADEAAAPEGGAAQAQAQPQAQGQPQGQPPAEGGGCPAGGCPAGGGGGEGGCPTGQCEIPPDPDTNRTVQLPDQTTSEPVKVIPTGEKQEATDIVDYHTTHHVWQPSERHHTTHKHRNLVRRHFKKVVFHPTFRRINRVVRTGSASDQVMPTEEVVEPTIDYGCAGAAVEAPVVEAPRVVTPIIVRPVPVLGGYHGYGY